MVRQACEHLQIVKNEIKNWYSSNNSNSLTLSECDSFLSCICDFDNYFDAETLCAITEYEWHRSASLISKNERLLFRAVMQKRGDTTDQRLHWNGENKIGATVVRSISLGASLFSGVLYDNTACVWFYKCRGRRLHVLSIKTEEPSINNVVHYPKTASILTQMCCLG